jgi:hypothetical protein
MGRSSQRNLATSSMAKMNWRNRALVTKIASVTTNPTNAPPTIERPVIR